MLNTKPGSPVLDHLSPLHEPALLDNGGPGFRPSFLHVHFVIRHPVSTLCFCLP